MEKQLVLKNENSVLLIGDSFPLIMSQMMVYCNLNEYWIFLISYKESNAYIYCVSMFSNK